MTREQEAAMQAAFWERSKGEYVSAECFEAGYRAALDLPSAKVDRIIESLDAAKAKWRMMQSPPDELCMSTPPTVRIGKPQPTAAKPWFRRVQASADATPAAAAAPVTADKPWYPDDSGEWVEHGGGPRPVDRDAEIEFLRAWERDERTYRKVVRRAGELSGWGSVVAYRVVRP